MGRLGTKTTPGGLIAYRKVKAKELVDCANKQTNPLSPQWTDVLPIPENVFITVECCKPNSCTQELLDSLFTVLSENMKDLYEQSSWGWDAEKKRAEAFSPKAWLLICRVSDNSSMNSPVLAGFVSFRFEREETRPVLYCYDIQLRGQYCGQSIGRYLMGVLSMIAKDSKMQSVMLTVFRSNERALRFFQNLGFTKDETDPSNFKGNPKVDYLILSKLVQ